MADDYTTMSDDALVTASTEARAQADALFTLNAVDRLEEAEALVASVRAIEAEQARRADVQTRFAAARDALTASAEEDVEDEAEDVEDEPEADAEVEASAEDDEPEADAEVEASAEEDDEPEADAEVEAAADETDEPDESDEDEEDKPKKKETPAMTASGTKKVNAAQRVGQRAARPTKTSEAPVVITASANVTGVASGSPLKDFSAVASVAGKVVKGFAPFNLRSAERVAERSGGDPVLTKVPVAAFGVNIPDEMKVGPQGSGRDYAASQNAVRDHRERVSASLQSILSGKPMTAAGWCAPSPYVYNFIADYVIDGLLTLPEIDASRGGVQVTQGPQLAQTTYADPSDFGFGGTEAQAIAGATKTCETIECPEFVDHRLDYAGYCWKIPFLTAHAYPELIEDAMRLSNVLYARRMNARFIGDVEAASTAVNATNAFGGTTVDTLEALTQVAVKERRWWNVGENAVMEVKLPLAAREIFKFDMARRSGLALNDVATDQKVAAHFAAHNLAVEYLGDWQERSGSGAATADWAATLKALIYPAGTFAKAVEDVVNLSAVHDAASLSANEFTGVFFEQGVKTIKLGYRSHVVTIPVCTAGTTGANLFACEPGSI